MSGLVMLAAAAVCFAWGRALRKSPGPFQREAGYFFAFISGAFFILGLLDLGRP